MVGYLYGWTLPVRLGWFTDLPLPLVVGLDVDTHTLPVVRRNTHTLRLLHCNHGRCRYAVTVIYFDCRCSFTGWMVSHFPVPLQFPARSCVDSRWLDLRNVELPVTHVGGGYRCFPLPALFRWVVIWLIPVG